MKTNLQCKKVTRISNYFIVQSLSPPTEWNQDRWILVEAYTQILLHEHWSKLQKQPIETYRVEFRKSLSINLMKSHSNRNISLITWKKKKKWQPKPTIKWHISISNMNENEDGHKKGSPSAPLITFLVQPYKFDKNGV